MSRSDAMSNVSDRDVTLGKRSLISSYLSKID
jgi:hypothetical protein